MTTVFTSPTDLQGLFEHTKFLTGQSNLSIKDFTRIANYAGDDYSSIAMSADGRVKFADTNRTDNETGYAQVVSGQTAYELDISFLQINRVEIKMDGVYQVVEAIDQRDYKDVSLEAIFSEAGMPRYYDWDGAIMKLYPAPNFSDSGDATAIANNSLKVECTRPTEYFSTSDTTKTIGIPRIHHEYIPLKAAQKVMMSTNDPSISGIERELIKWEGVESKGRMTGGKIREYYNTRDENTVRRLKPKDRSYQSFSKNNNSTSQVHRVR